MVFGGMSCLSIFKLRMLKEQYLQLFDLMLLVIYTIRLSCWAWGQREKQRLRVWGFGVYRAQSYQNLSFSEGFDSRLGIFCKCVGFGARGGRLFRTVSLLRTTRCSKLLLHKVLCKKPVLTYKQTTSLQGPRFSLLQGNDYVEQAKDFEIDSFLDTQQLQNTEKYTRNPRLVRLEIPR